MAGSGRISEVRNAETGKVILLTWDEFRTALERTRQAMASNGLDEDGATELFHRQYELSEAVLHILARNELVTVLEEEKDRRAREHNSHMGRFKPMRHGGLWAGGLQRRGTVD